VPQVPLMQLLDSGLDLAILAVNKTFICSHCVLYYKHRIQASLTKLRLIDRSV